MIDRGIFNLKTPHQLFEKLQREEKGQKLKVSDRSLEEQKAASP